MLVCSTQPGRTLGTVPLVRSGSYFSSRHCTEHSMINFFKPTGSQIVDLAKACQPATFGVDQKDVLDESYRKAGKMDANNFATQFSPSDLGMVAAIEHHLLRGRGEQTIRAELYKLNVYGPGAFFKSHVDTPRSDTMFGSLVIVLPTVHEGGSLVFRHDDDEWTFESAKAVKMDPPQAAFAAFFSDVEHEVLPVTSGYRITLTYNLYFAKATEVVTVENTKIDETLKGSLDRLLKDPNFLPNGGALGFGLSHKYPINPHSTSLRDILGRLKGPDAAVKQLCESFSLKVAAKAIYRDEDDNRGACLLNRFFDFRYAGEVDCSIVDYLSQYGDAEKVYDEADDDPEGLLVVWAKSLEKVNQFEDSYIAYGNEATLGCVYGEVCLIATVPSADERGVQV
ncbi:hypothetical protein CPB83DRAFT_841574 [Crepidotus variabilis]|uniref:Fe2OG dioxygenase domain-containing protein n=1 Tax=Crepidotus variabilis TaxID=179855 RepID=A0A9P6JWN8_9AGAR|nr:hypothetical protein CPB83DRAFT_841574 [Crepidotus variabilis]